MNTVIAVTSIREQEEVTHNILEQLKLTYVSDLTITIIQSRINQIDVYHAVGESKNLASSYKIVLVPITISLDVLQGYPRETNINVTRVLKKIDSLKDTVIHYVNAKRFQKPPVDNTKALQDALKNIFG